MTFTPRRFVAGPHAQTILGNFLRPSSGVERVRETLDTPDDDVLDLDFVHVPERTWDDLGSGAPIALLLHGLGGDSSAGYIITLAQELAARGIRSVAMNYRGCGGTPNRRARLFHAGATDDPRFVLETLLDRFPGVPIAALGVSLGGHMLLKLATEAPLPAGVKGFVAVSSPLDLDRCARCLEHGMGRIYALWILRRLRAFVRAKQDAGWTFTERDRRDGVREPDWGAVFRARTIRGFDDAIIAPLHGFADAADYYARASCGPRLANIDRPTVLIRADDDPFLDPGDLALSGLSNPHIDLVRTARGGHVGFVQSRRAGSRFWSEAVAAERVSAILTA